MTISHLKEYIKVHVIRITKGAGISVVVDAIVFVCREYCEHKLEDQRRKCWEEGLHCDNRSDVLDAVRDTELVEID